MFGKIAGRDVKLSYTFFRGEHTNFYPQDPDFGNAGIVLDHIVRGLTPAAPFIDVETNVVAFGSCFASHISRYLNQMGFNISTKKDQIAYISKLGDGILHTHAIRQQLAWAWDGQQPEVPLWHGYKGEEFGYSEEVRLATKELFDRAEVFIITLGLSEVWFDEPTGEVFWRAVPQEFYDPERHRFRTLTQRENLENLRKIHETIRKYRGDVPIILTLSPIPLAATFRPIGCVTANAASKANLRSALDEFFSLVGPVDPNVYYFPSYEIVLNCFPYAHYDDRRHVHEYVLDFTMGVFERFYCVTGLDDTALAERFDEALKKDAQIAVTGRASMAAERLERHARKRGELPAVKA